MRKLGRAVHITSTHGPTDGRIFYRECRALQKAGWDVSVVAHGVPSQPRDGISFVELPKGFTRLTMLMEPYKIVRFLMHLDADIYHFHDPDLLLAAGLLTRRAKRVIYDCHEWYQQVFPYKGYHPLLAASATVGLSLVETVVIPRLSAIVTPTDELASLYATRNKKVISIRNFAPLEGWDVRPEEGACNQYDLIHVGTVSFPRLRVMLDIVKASERLGRRITLCLLGVTADIKRYIDENNDFGGLVEAIERVPETRVPEFLHKARIGLNYHPYQPRFMVAIPMKVFEYMRHGLPFVSTALPPLKTLLEHSEAGVLVQENTVDAFVEVISRLLDDEELMARMGEEGQKLIRESYNWEAESIKLIRLYESLLS